MAVSIFKAPHYQDPDKAREYLEGLLWPNGPVCPHCGVEGGHYALKGKATRPGVWKCHDCRKQFTVTVNTVFHRSHIPLNVWLQAVYLMNASKKGISSHQLHRMLGITYRTAWFMTHRIREAMDERFNPGKLGSGGAIVEADETFWGTATDQKDQPRKKKPGHGHKMKVFALVERGGRAKAFHVPDVTATTLRDHLVREVSKEANLMTDEAPMYKVTGQEFASHESVNHSQNEYSRGITSTNTVESYFAILKRGLIGTYHHVGENHLKRYVHEFNFRYNYRKSTDGERAEAALKGISGKRLTYQPTGS